MKQLYRTGGIPGLWRGVTASMMRTGKTNITLNLVHLVKDIVFLGVGSAAQLSTFSNSREAINSLDVRYLYW